MISRKFILWDVDTQADFMLPGGKLYVPGAEKLLPNLSRLTDAARHGHVFLVSSGDSHTLSDPELREWPQHCMRGTLGAGIVPETMTDRFFVVPNRPDAPLPARLADFHQAILEKQTLDVFENPNTDAALARIGEFTDPDAEFIVFGVVTEFCVKAAVEGLLRRGRRVAIVTDAIETIKPEDGQRTLNRLRAAGAKLVSTNEILGQIENSVALSA